MNGVVFILGCFSIYRWKNGKEAIEIFTSNPQVDLILMDIKMPVMDGHEAAIMIKSIKPELPIVAQSAYAMEYERVKYEGVFDDYLTKPINRQTLSDILSKYVNTIHTKWNLFILA